MAGVHQQLSIPENIQHLKPELLDDPIQMVYDFCFLLNIKDSRAMLWKMTSAFLGSEHADGLDRHQRSDYIFLYEMLSALMEASYLINIKRKWKNNKRKKKNPR